MGNQYQHQSTYSFETATFLNHILYRTPSTMSNEQNPGLLGNIGDTVGKTVGGVSNTVGNTVGGLGSTVGNATSGLGETVSGATQGVGNTARSAGEGVKSNVASLGGQKQTGDNPLGLNRSAHVEGQ